MDVATIANFLLFLGAFGASFALDTEESAGPRLEEDSLYDREAYDRTDRLGDADDEVTADADNLAWFMEGGNDALTASDGADFADLGRGDDRADMGAGNDLIAAQDGNDSVAGASGADLALGGGGDDWLDGGADHDSLAGETGEDLLTGGAGSDILAGGEGNDVISGFSQLGGASGSLSGADGADQMFGGTGDDRLILGRGDSATGGEGADRFEMDARWHDGNGPFTITDYRAGEDSLVLQYDPQIDPDSSLPLTPELEVQLSEDGLSSLVLLDGAVVAVVEGVTGLTAADISLLPDGDTDTGYRPEDFDATLPGSAADDRAAGSAGDDYGRFGAGDDAALGAAGEDSLLGDGGSDTLAGETGDDTLKGDDGDDALAGDGGNDALFGGLGADRLTGGDGVDRLWGGGGNDILSGGHADAAGGSEAVIDGADSLSGGDGDDLLLLGRGDLGLGGTGADIFWLDAATNAGAAAVATLHDYDADTDRIEIHYDRIYDQDMIEIAPTVAVLMGPMSAYAVITFNGEPLTHVTGATGLTAADLALVAAG
ncbi:calcium-binding protein [Tabrizicola oligotrophica]|uniref:Calcium-binding protein n=1 Tax=Tabrizicola oligotrophica TaxID=2710650 RepID=A0A6M0QP55_9RHOB|nr:hypothetical protein [Tabrizicola oligotrophica]NEY89268.1 hypothetical protein [Tabrizicola oligotrophica]